MNDSPEHQHCSTTASQCDSYYILTVAFKPAASIMTHYINIKIVSREGKSYYFHEVRQPPPFLVVKDSNDY